MVEGAALEALVERKVAAGTAVGEGAGVAATAGATATAVLAARVEVAGRAVRCNSGPNIHSKRSS